MGFTKLDEGILKSSIMAESPATFKVWIALLASCDYDGVARVSSIFLSAACHLNQSITDKAIEVLSLPDLHSRTEAEEGRRIQRVDGGYFVINYHKYRAFTYSNSPEATRKRQYRRRAKEWDSLGHVGTCPGHSASASASASSLSSSENKEQENIKGGCNSDDLRLVQLLIDLMLENHPESSIVKRLTEKRQAEWIKACRLMREADGKTPEAIEAVIRFSQADDFWKSNILSMPKLREKFDQLWMKANRKTDKFAGIKEWLNDGTKK